MKKFIVSGLVAFSFVLLILAAMFFINSVQDYRSIDPLELEMMSQAEIIQHVYESQEREKIAYYFLIPIFGFFGVAVGASIYFIMSSGAESKSSPKKIDASSILMLLPHDERKVVKKLVQEKGKSHQSELAYLEGFNKLKAHRVVESLVKKEVVEKEAMGKIRVIRLREDLYELLKK